MVERNDFKPEELIENALNVDTGIDTWMQELEAKKTDVRVNEGLMLASMLREMYINILSAFEETMSQKGHSESFVNSILELLSERAEQILKLLSKAQKFSNRADA